MRGLNGILALDAEDRIVFANPRCHEILGVAPEGRLLWDILNQPPRPWDRMCKTRHKRMHLAIRPAGEIAGQRCLVIIDCTEAERARLRSVALLEVAASLTVHKPTLDDVATAVLSATGGQYCWIALFDSEKPKLLGKAGKDPYRIELVERLMLEGATTSTREAYNRREPVVYRDISQIPAARNYPEAYEGLDNHVVYSVPMATMGALTLLCDEAMDEELPFLQAVADQAALAVENARLIKALKGKAVLEERQRIARELHDSVNQVIYGIGLGARAGLAHMAAGKAEAVEGALHYIVAQAEAAIVEMRSLICELRPESLEQEGLVGLLERQLATLEARHDLSVESTLVEPSLPLEQKHALWRVLQEALANVTRHSQATQLQLFMRTEPDILKVIVQDNGIGFDPTQPHPGHYGLHTMRERVEPLGGTLAIEGHPGQGVRLTVALPHPGERG